eukprot:Plantae.Rhodophyta-Hildenbrandia_rubra.ctg7415.p2 GENE.Plantae.Rhodophyta-Hildenbrandia_rubra.ctg7415~~Plantae.Rhodophyta-Hildenbrandia_rubra.ctg7415.p2  ORF type:complete len:282 (+),score=51.51 Plantae.Rhodophyta-Hildenbrandia_rubra.ctg7415:304-1149(+)
MNGNGGYRIIAQCRGVTTLTIDYDTPRYNRKPHKDEDVEQRIAEKWKLVTKENPALFNMSKFRLAACEATSNETGEQEILLKIGVTDYRTFQGTHCGSNPLAFWGRDSMSMILGNATIVETSDGQIPLLRRSESVGEGKGKLTLVGGHAEPMHLKRARNEDVKEELFQGAKREILEELFLESSPPNVGFLGIVERQKDGKPQMVFVTQISLSGIELKLHFQKRNNSQDENCNLLLLHKADLRAIVGDINANNCDIMPDHRGALELAALYFEAQLTPVNCYH